MNKEFRGEMDNKKMFKLEEDLTDAFDKMWKQYLDFEREIWELSKVYENYPNEAYKRVIFNMCETAIGQLNAIKMLAKVLYDGAIYEQFSDSCEQKQHDFHKISHNILMGKSNQK